MRKYMPIILAFCMILCSFSGCGVSQENTFETESTDDTNVTGFLDEDIVVESDVIDYDAYFNGFYAEEGVFSDTTPWAYSYEILSGEFVPGGVIQLRVTRKYTGDVQCVWKSSLTEEEHDELDRIRKSTELTWEEKVRQYQEIHQNRDREHYPYPNEPDWTDRYELNYAVFKYYKDGQPANYGRLKLSHSLPDRSYHRPPKVERMFVDKIIYPGDTFTSVMPMPIPDDVVFDEIWLLLDNYQPLAHLVEMGIIYSKDSPDCEDDEVVDTATVADENQEINAE